jgi:hypothetical protein
MKGQIEKREPRLIRQIFLNLKHGNGPTDLDRDIDASCITAARAATDP